MLVIALALSPALPLSLHSQCPDGTPPPCAGARARPVAPVRGSIAVLPFANRSPDTADAYLADEFPEQITGRLSRIPQLHVTSATAVAAQWRRTPDALASARALHVEWLVTGSLRRAQAQVSASVELVRTATGEQAWSSLMRRGDGDIGAIEAMVAESVAVAAAGRLAPRQRAVLVRQESRDPEAYRRFLYAKAMMARRTRQDINAAVVALQQAVRTEPAFAVAWARLAQARILQTFYGSAEGYSNDSLLSLARDHAGRALALDSGSAEAWLSLGMWDEVEHRLGDAWSAIDRAARLDSLNANIESQAGYLYTADLLTLPDEAERHYRRAVLLDPDLRIGWRHIGVAFALRDQLATGIAYLDTALANGGWQVGFCERAWLRYETGDVQGALADQARADSLGPLAPVAAGLLYMTARRAIYAAARGDSTTALAALADRRPDLAAAANRALVAMALGRRDEALDALDLLRSIRDPGEPTCAPSSPCSTSLATWRLINDPLFGPLHEAPRFQRLWNDTRPHVPWLAGGS